MTFPARGENVKLGKGSLMLNPIVDSVLTGMLFSGQLDSLSLSSDITTVEMYSNTQASGGLVARDRTRVGFTLTANLKEYELNMLSFFLLGEQATSDQSLQNNGTFEIDSAKPGRYYYVGARRITDVSLSMGSDPMASNTDYDVNSEQGVVFIREGAIVPDGGADVVVTFDAPALTIKKIKIGKSSQQLCELVYTADDANSSGAAAQDKLTVWRVDVAPDGELGFISDDYGGYNLTMAVLSDGTNHPDEPFGKLERITA